MLEILQLLKYKLKSFRLTPFPIIMLTLITIRTFSSNQLQRLMVAITSVLAEIGFMYLMTTLLKAAGSNFILPLPGIIIFIVILSITTLEFICLQVYSKKKKC